MTHSTMETFLENLLETKNKDTITYIMELYKVNKLERISKLIPVDKYNKLLLFLNKEIQHKSEDKKSENKQINESFQNKRLCHAEVRKENAIEININNLIRINKNNLLCIKKESSYTSEIINHKERIIGKCKEDKKYNTIDLNVNDPYFEKKLHNLVNDNQVLIIQGETGTGKTTLVPLALMNYFNKIIITQPRRLAAVSVCNRVRQLLLNKFMHNEEVNAQNIQIQDNYANNYMHEFKEKVNRAVGYKVRFDDQSHAHNKITYCTDGILLQNYNVDYDLLIIDEAHERSLNIDLLLSLYKYFDKKIKLIIMSATIDLSKFIEYFKLETVVNLIKESFSVDTFYLRSKSEDYLNDIEGLIVTLIDNFGKSKINNEGKLNNEIASSNKSTSKLISETIKNKLRNSLNVLVFLPGKEEIFTLKERFINYEYFYILHGDMKIEEMNKIYEEKNIKIILSTNIAETSITIQDLDVVVDSGYHNQMYNKNINVRMNQLVRNRITKSMAQQRKGRVGRVKDGLLFRMYSKEEFESLQEYNTPEILISNINSVILKVLSLGINIYSFNFIEDIKREEINKSLISLVNLDLVKDDKITHLGRKVNYLPLEIELGRMLLEAYKYNNELEVTVLVSLLSSGSFKLTHYNKKGDFVSMIISFKEWMNNKFSINYLERKDLNKRSFLLSKNIFFQLKKNLLLRSNEDYLSLVRILMIVYNKNICKRIENYYINIYTGIICYIHPNSIEIDSKYVIYDEIIKTKKVYMKNVGELPDEIVNELGL